MPRGQITRYEIQSRLFRIKDESAVAIFVAALDASESPSADRSFLALLASAVGRRVPEVALDDEATDFAIVAASMGLQ